MLETINDLPAGIVGLRAKGTIAREDYDRVVLPLLEDARRQGQRIRLLYQLGPEFDGFTPGGAWEDLRVGFRYLRLFERCAVVTDIPWVRTATRGMTALMPCPVQVFRNQAFQEAVEWLTSHLEPSVSYRMIPGAGVLVVEPHGRLRANDFDALDAAADSWIESADGALRGVVVHARQFPGWENLGSLLRHVRFVRDHHRKIRRVALAVDGPVAEITPVLVDHFVQAELKQFGTDDLDVAIMWAGSQPTRQAPEA
ncbi:MAG: STAS/SEC14 domain-containing protein [Vicinamibacterales bacterium]